jgi:hypothetical protein
MRRRHLPAVAILAAAVAGCERDTLGVERRRPPVIENASVEPNPNNVLSAIVTARVHGADSIAVRLRPADENAAELTTPAVTVADGIATIPVLGLLPGQRYVFRVVARASGDSTTGDPLALTTGTLPPDLPRYVASGSNPTRGYVVFAAGRYGLVIDDTGRVVWYKRFPNGPGLTFTAQPTGRYYARPPGALLSDPTAWVEIDALGNVTRTFGCANGLTPRFHDLIATGDDTFWLLCDETRDMDLSGVGGVAQARVTATDVQRISSDGKLLFHWSPFDHFAITDGDPRDRVGPMVNWTHGNALDLAPDGNLIASFRNLGEITKINTATGAVMWRLGGQRNTFTFPDTPATGFVGQHSARASAAGAVLLLDNLGDPAQSRGERYALDEQTMTARLIGSYGSLPGVTTQIGGSVQDLPNDHTLVSFGTAGRVEEYDAAGRVVWRIEKGADYVFHAQRIRSLYEPGVGLAR